MMQRFSSASFIGGIIVGVLISGAWFAGSTGDFSLSTAFNLSSTTPSKAEAGSQSSLISVADQPAGNAVFVGSIGASWPVWVAVREMNGRTLGNVLGAAKIGGARTDLSVPLLRATVPGQQYAVELYRDDGDGAFDPARFSVYVDFDTGSRVVAYFNTKN